MRTKQKSSPTPDPKAIHERRVAAQRRTRRRRMTDDFERLLTLAFGNGVNDVAAHQPAIRKQARLVRAVLANLLGVEVDTLVGVYILRDPSD